MGWKGLVQGFFRTFGFEISHRGNPETYTECVPYGYFTYSPWFEEWFQKQYKDGIESHSAVKEDRCYILLRFMEHCLHLEGDFAECGVYKGGTALQAARTLKSEDGGKKRLHLFDTFAGMPNLADADSSTHKKGDFGDVSLDAVKALLAGYSFVSYYPGLIPETLAPVKDRQFAFAHIDVDLYESTKECFSFFYPRMARGGIMVCDDYGAPAYVKSAKLAVDEFFEDKPENVISLRTGQCFVIKL